MWVTRNYKGFLAIVEETLSLIPSLSILKIIIEKGYKP